MIVNLERLYRAGEDLIPAHADRLSTIAQAMYEATSQLDSVGAKMGDPPLMTSLLTVAGDINDCLTKAVTSANNAAAAILATANYFRDTDENARAAFERLDPELRAGADSAPHVAYVPREIKDPEAKGSTTIQTSEDRNGRPVDVEVHVDSTPDPLDRDQDEPRRESRERDAQPGRPIQHRNG